MLRPVEPSENDCCGNGCNPCVFDVYRQKLKAYDCAQSENVIPSMSENGISQLENTVFILQCKIDLCYSHKLLLFKNKSNEQKVWWSPGDHFLYKHFGDNITCTRAYSPIKLLKYANDVCFEFMILVKDYKNNSASSKLCSLEIGDETLWRGPYGCYKILTNQYKRVLMVAQGTGIAPLYSIITQITDNEDDFTNIVLLYCCRSFDQIPLREELYEFSSYWNFKYKIFISNIDDGNRKLYYKEPIENHKLSIEDIKIYKKFTSDDHIILCGSPEFNNSIKTLFLREGAIERNMFSF